MSSSQAEISETISQDDPPLFINQNHASSLENDRPILYITSYGHRIGPLIPTPDITFDIRALPNPPKSVRTGHTGISKALRDGFFADERVQRRFQEISAQVRSGVEEAGAAGVEELSVGVCCEIGRHRSVAFVEELGRVRFEEWNVVVGHRDVHRKSSSKKARHDRTDVDGTSLNIML